MRANPAMNSSSLKTHQGGRTHQALRAVTSIAGFNIIRNLGENMEAASLYLELVCCCIDTYTGNNFVHRDPNKTLQYSIKRQEVKSKSITNVSVWVKIW